MSGYKIDRICEDIEREVTAILREVKDPRVTKTLLSVVKVEVTRDLSFAKIFVSSIDGLEEAEVAVEGLRSATGFIKRELGSRLKIRHVPNLIFTATDSIEYGGLISKMLESL